MQAEQRTKIEEAELQPRSALWKPFTVHGIDGTKRRQVTTDDLGSRQYVVVEDIDDDSLVLEVSKWPRLDGGGRLTFEGDPFEIYTSLKTFQTLVHSKRNRADTTDPERDVRVGDVFIIKGIEPGDTEIDGRSKIVDITRAARNAAKSALYGAAASAVTAAEARTARVISEEEAIERPYRISKGEIDISRKGQPATNREKGSKR